METEKQPIESTPGNEPQSASVQHDSGEKGRSENASLKGPPNGGWRAWLQVAGSFLILCSAWGLLLVFGALQAFYEFNILKDYSASSIAWIGTLQSFLLVFTGLFTGPVYDLGYHKTLLVVGGSLTVFGMIMLSLCTKYYQIMLAQGFCVGLGTGIIYLPALAIIAASFTTKLPIAMAMVVSGTSIGGIIFLLAFQHLIVPLGFAWTIRVMAFISLATFILGIPMILCRSVPTSKKRRAFIDNSAWTDIHFLTLCIGGFFTYLGYFGPILFLPLFAQTSLGLPLDKALNLPLLFSGSSFFGRILGSVLAQRTRVMPPWLVCRVCSGALCLIWPAIHTYGGAVTFAVLYGLVSGPLTVFPAVVVPYFCPSLDVLGTRMGMIWAFAAFAFLLGSPISALVADPAHGHFLGFQLFNGFALLVGAALLLPNWKLVQRKQQATFEQ